MSQNREPPAFQEYAAQLLAKREFRLLTLAEKGLCWHLRLECWTNRTVPADLAALARYIGEDVAVVERALPQIVPVFFVREGGNLRCPELDNYRAHLEAVREKQSAGGKKSAANKAAAANGAKSRASKGIEVPCKVPASSSASSLQVFSTVKTSPNQSKPASQGDDYFPDAESREWASAYSSAEAIAEAYDRESNGY